MMPPWRSHESVCESQHHISQIGPHQKRLQLVRAAPLVGRMRQLPLFSRQPSCSRILFAISPNSASCERVFSLLKLMFGDQQISTLADAIRAALMLRYNDRTVA